MRPVKFFKFGRQARKGEDFPGSDLVFGFHETELDELLMQNEERYAVGSVEKFPDCLPR